MYPGYFPQKYVYFWPMNGLPPKMSKGGPSSRPDVLSSKHGGGSSNKSGHGIHIADYEVDREAMNIMSKLDKKTGTYLGKIHNCWIFCSDAPGNYEYLEVDHSEGGEWKYELFCSAEIRYRY